MCRMLGYLGEAASLRTLVEAPPHSLVVQSYAARELVGAVVSADGWGASWYLDQEPEPCAYRSILPIWADINRGSLCKTVRSRCVLAAVRSATDPLSVSPANTQPFSFERLSFVHNGYIEGFSARLQRRLRSELSDTQYGRIQGNTDSEHLFALLADAYAGRSAERSAERLLGAVLFALARARSLCAEAGAKALFSVIAADGQSLVAARAATGTDPPSLYVRALPTGALVASERLDDVSGWAAIAPDSAVVIEDGEPPRVVALS
jgi:glutamine amidotransferase